MENWKDKISIKQYQPPSEVEFKSNTFGLLFLSGKKSLDIVLIPLNEKISLNHLKDSPKYTLFFEREFIEEDDVEYALDVLRLFKLTKDQQIGLEGSKVVEVEQLLGFLMKEFRKRNANYQIIKSLLKVLILHLIRFQKSHLLPQDLKQNRVYQFLNLMETNFKTEVKTDFYAAKLGISSKRLNQILKDKLQHTAVQIIRQRQITEIKRELQKKDKTIKEIAFDYNFNSVSSFSRFFKRYTNVSPKKFNFWL